MGKRKGGRVLTWGMVFEGQVVVFGRQGGLQRAGVFSNVGGGFKRRRWSFLKATGGLWVVWPRLMWGCWDSCSGLSTWVLR